MIRFFLLLLVLPLCPRLSAQNIAIRLKQANGIYSPSSYYINSVTDDRGNGNTIGKITNHNNKEHIVLEGGVAPEIERFLKTNVRWNNNSQPIELHIIKLDADFKRKGTLWKWEGVATFAFYVENRKLGEFTNKSHGENNSEPAAFAETFLRKTIESNIKQFEQWWLQNRSRIPTAPAVKVNVVLGVNANNTDHIVYSLKRPLRMEDFEAPVKPNTGELAVTSSGIGVYYDEHVENGQIVLNINVRPFFQKSKSWFKETARNTNVLAHEQAHFDITAIKACELAAALRDTAFTRQNYQALADELYKKYVLATNDEQEAYDNETQHGTVKDKQEAWEKKVRDQVRTIGCY